MMDRLRDRATKSISLANTYREPMKAMSFSAEIGGKT